MTKFVKITKIVTLTKTEKYLKKIRGIYDISYVIKFNNRTRKHDKRLLRNE